MLGISVLNQSKLRGQLNDPLFWVWAHIRLEQVKMFV
jgi:hypothetical protein